MFTFITLSLSKGREREAVVTLLGPFDKLKVRVIVCGRPY